MSVYYSSTADTLLSLPSPFFGFGWFFFVLVLVGFVCLFDCFFKLVFLMDYFLNQGGLGHITFHFYSASTNKREQLVFLTVWSLVHCKLNHNYQLILHRQLNSCPALLY